MDSRAKFEEWARTEGFDLDKWEEDYESLLTVAAYQGWKAGRESMREEACNAADLSWVKDPCVTASDAIKQIET